MEDFFDRFKQLIEDIGDTPYKISKRTTVSEANLSNYMKGKSMPTLKILSKLANIYNIDLNWLVTGKISKDTITPKSIPNCIPKPTPKPTPNNNFNEERHVYKLRTDTLIENQNIPLYDIEAIAGILPILNDLNSQKPIDFIYIPNAPRCDGAMYATGDSMYPLLKSGDILAFKIIDDFLNDVYWGEMYILYIEVAGDLFRVVKYVQKGKDKDHFMLISQNKHHQDKEVKISKIKAMAQVKITIRIN